MERPVVFYNQGQQLNGILHSPTGFDAPCPAIAFFHGFTGTKVEPHRIFVKTARELASIGFYVLRFDFRGSGDSAGDFSEMTISGEISDAIKSIDVLTAMQGVDPERIGILGLSMGGCVCGVCLWARCTCEVNSDVGAALGRSARPETGNFGESQKHTDTSGNRTREPEHCRESFL